MTSTLIIFTLALITALLGWIFSMLSTLKRYLHLLQLDEYNPLRMLGLVLRNPNYMQLWGVEIYGMVSIFAGGMLAFSISRTLFLLVPLGYYIWGVGCFVRSRQNAAQLRNAKKPLVMTSRAKRIFATSIAISFAVLSVTGTLTYHLQQGTIQGVLSRSGLGSATSIYISVMILPLALLYIIERLSSLSAAASIYLSAPTEMMIRRKYMQEAKARIDEIGPRVIGITGSYGKTGTKEILSSILSDKFNIFRPPGSYNTLMGVTRIIREGLRPHHDAFIVEMGAYRAGSIRKLCDLTNPTHGIITTIGVQHLERFKTVEAIKNAKGELAEALGADGTLVTNADNENCRLIAEAHSGKVVFFSVTGKRFGNNCVLAKEIEVSVEGTDFLLEFANGELHPAHLSLLGRSAVANALAASALAEDLGVERKDIVKNLAQIPHVKHRLQPIKKGNGVLVLDDAFNSNPVGAANALELLSISKPGKRILVTPGMVELGVLEEESNKEFGRQASKSCDIAVLIGRQNSQYIEQGLLEKNFNSENILKYDTLNQAIEYLETILESGDTMLLENDLPDQYN